MAKKEDRSTKLRIFKLNREERVLVFNVLCTVPENGKGFDQQQTRDLWPVALDFINDGWDDGEWALVAEKIDPELNISLKNSVWEEAIKILEKAFLRDLIIGNRRNKIVDFMKEVQFSE